MREWILTVVNSLSGGELEQYIKMIAIKIAHLQKQNTVDKTILVGQPADLNNQEHQIRIRQQNQLHEVKPRYHKKSKLKGLQLVPGSKDYLQTFNEPLLSFNSLTPPNEIKEGILRAFPLNKNVVFVAKTLDVEYSFDNGLTIWIQICKRVTTDS